MSIVQLSMFFFVVAVSCDSFYIISKRFMFVNNFFIYNKECKVAFENKNKNLKKCVDKTKYTWYYIEVVADKNKKRQKII